MKFFFLILCLTIFSVILADVPATFTSIPCDVPGNIGLVYEAQVGAEKIRVPFALFLPKKYDVDKKYKWPTLLEAPEIYAAAVPICGRPWKEPDVVATKLQNCSVWNIVVGADSPDFVDGAKTRHTALVNKGVDTQLMIVPNIGHWVWMLYYKKTEFYYWVIRPVRPNTEMQNQAEGFRKLQNKENALVGVISVP